MKTSRADDLLASHFARSGYAVIRRAFEPQALSLEVDAAMQHGLRPGGVPIEGAGGVEFRSVVMMCELTPVSLALVDQLAPVAARLLGRRVLPGRAKGTRYFGSSRLHTDSDLAIPSLGFVAYLEPVDARSGALRVVPGSHRGEPAGAPSNGTAVPTLPGDVIVFDEHLAHGSVGGAVRRQWRADFIADPVTDAEEALFRATFERVLDPTWDGGDDTERYPSYGTYWRSRHQGWAARLRDLGVDIHG
jgi:hypothetical protein